MFWWQGLLGTIAFAWAAGSSSGLISMIENGTYTMMSATWIERHRILGTM